MLPLHQVARPLSRFLRLRDVCSVNFPKHFDLVFFRTVPILFYNSSGMCISSLSTQTNRKHRRKNYVKKKRDEESSIQQWAHQIDSMIMLLETNNLFTKRELQKGIESLGPVFNNELSYNEKCAISAIHLLLKKKKLDNQVLKNAFAGPGNSSQESLDIYKQWVMKSPLPSKIIPDSNRGPKIANGFRRAIIREGLISPNQLSIAAGDYEPLGKADYGPRIVARAWSDPLFQQRLLTDAEATVAELDIKINNKTKFAKTKIVFVKNTMNVHNVVMCPEATYYPRSILGMPPKWYKSKEYITLALSNPQDLLQAFDTGLPSSIEVRIHKCTADIRYIVLPMRPNSTKGWSEKKLVKLITRDCLLGITFPHHPRIFSKKTKKTKKITPFTYGQNDVWYPWLPISIRCPPWVFLPLIPISSALLLRILLESTV